MTTLAEKLAAWTAALRYEDLPPDVVHQAKRLMIDTLGCALGGYDSEPVRIARAQAATVTSTQPATILCSGERTSADLAAFANGSMIRYLDFNDGYIAPGTGGHPSDMIAAVLPDILIKGADWAHFIAGREEVEAAGGKVLALPLEPGFSTTNIEKELLARLP